MIKTNKIDVTKRYFDKLRSLVLSYVRKGLINKEELCEHVIGEGNKRGFRILGSKIVKIR